MQGFDASSTGLTFAVEDVVVVGSSSCKLYTTVAVIVVCLHVRSHLSPTEGIYRLAVGLLQLELV